MARPPPPIGLGGAVMRGSIVSSGDMLADQRFRYAEGLLADGDVAAAADLLMQTIERVPGWAPAWAALAQAEERQGRAGAAAKAWVRLDELDPNGIFAAQLHLARLAGTVPTGMPAAYVAALFDDYARRFERHLVTGLGYRAPTLIAEDLTELCGARHFPAALDLGCGTGLMGAAIRDRTEALDGVDLSAAMVAEARCTGVYRTLRVAEIVDHLRGVVASSYDLVLAADVFVYVGALEAVMAVAARVLAPGGILAFSAQTSRHEDIAIGADMRFSHSASYLGAVLAGAGLECLRMREAWGRRENQQGVPGLVVTARKP